MPSYRDILKFAKTGIAAPGMSYSDMLRARAIGGVLPVSTITGLPPLTFQSDGKPLTEWTLWGNGQQTGTPTPDNPIMPTFCGVRTGNLFPLDINKLHVGRIENDGTIDFEVGTITVGTDSMTYQSTEAWRGFYTDYIAVSDNEKLTFSPITSTIACSCNCYDTADNFLGKASAVSTAAYRTFTPAEGTAKVRISVTSSDMQYTISKPMLNLGTTALPYEPYGYKIPFTTSQTVHVYLGQTQTVRRVKKLIFDGTESWSLYGSGLHFQITIDNQAAERGTFIPISNAFNGIQVTQWDDLQSGDFSFSPTQRSTVRFRYDVYEGNLAGWKSYLAAQYAAGTPVTVWYVLATPQTGIVNEPLCKIGDYADELHSADAAVTIPTAKGENVLTVDTDLPPSSVSITGHIK